MLIKIFLSCIDWNQDLLHVDSYRVKPWCFSAMPGGMWMVKCPHAAKAPETHLPIVNYWREKLQFEVGFFFHTIYGVVPQQK